VSACVFGTRVLAEGNRQRADQEQEGEDHKFHDVKYRQLLPLGQIVLVLESIMDPDRWLGVELRHLIALEAVAREMSFGRAAESLGYTQSAVSQQIATLERIVGEKLVERPGGPRKVSLTEAGHLLLRHAEAIVSRLSAAQADMDALAGGQAGTISVGVYQSVGEHILPSLLRRFVADWPRVEITLEESANDVELLEHVERGGLDLSFVDLPVPEGPFESVEVARDPYVLVLPADADEPDEATLAAAAELDLIGFRHCRGTASIEALAPEPLNFVFKSDHNATVQAMVAAGFGAAVVPRLTIDEQDERIRVLALEGVGPRMIGIAWHRDRHRGPAARAFVELAQQVGAELGAVPA
jgi:DNA-binding transcriptional LysR family regulator